MLICKISCDAPGIGFFKAGDEVRDPKQIEKLKGSANFYEQKEEKKKDVKPKKRRKKIRRIT